LNRRWFIIGSGPSLKTVDFSLLEGEVTFAMNRVHLMYDRTDWRPTLFFMVDHNQQNPHNYWRDCIKAHWDTPKWLWEGFRDGVKGFPSLEKIGPVPNTTWIPRCPEHHYYMGDNYMRRVESWHLPDICTAYSGLSAMMQIAVLQGATEIVLLGCDGYGPDYSQNHFTERYTDDERDRSKMDMANMTQLHEVAKRSSPIPILNANPDSLYEMYPKVQLEEVLSVNQTELYPA